MSRSPTPPSSLWLRNTVFLIPVILFALVVFALLAVAVFAPDTPWYVFLIGVPVSVIAGGVIYLCRGTVGASVKVGIGASYGDKSLSLAHEEAAAPPAAISRIKAKRPA